MVDGVLALSVMLRPGYKYRPSMKDNSAATADLHLICPGFLDFGFYLASLALVLVSIGNAATISQFILQLLPVCVVKSLQ